MTPGARIQAAIDILGQIDREDQDSASLIERYFRSRRFAGAGDRRAITTRVYDNLRHRARLDWWIGRAGLAVEPDPRSRVIAQLAVYDRTSPAEMDTLFSDTRHCPEALSPAERQLADALYRRPPRHADMPKSVRLEYPAWMDASLTVLWGDQLERELQAFGQTAPVDIRVNTLKATREQVQASLAGDRVETDPTPLSPIGLRLQGRARLGGTQGYKNGLFEVQDEGSQIIALLTGAQPGMTVVDYCAGAGGKTLALAAQMADDPPPGEAGQAHRIRGQLIACDVSGYRMDRMTPRLTRAGASNIRRQTVAARDDSWVKANAGMADRVLADAPCTGTGAWRRDLEAKWRLRADDMAELIETQRGVLEQAAGLVAPGGRLVYATCSILTEENEDQLDWFLQNVPGYTPLSIQGVWRDTIGGTPPVEAGTWLRLSPAATDTDGFFCAVLERS
ncbi:MAG: RsmB/NOP family class I SAM-dependent RNA methyltransferase [Rhodospirillaceae bacterium]